MHAPTSTTEREVEEPKGTISFSVRLTEKQRDLLSRAAEKRSWSLSSLLKNAALEKAVHILNTAAPSRVDFRGTAEEVARQIFTPRSGLAVGSDGEPVAAVLYARIEEGIAERDPHAIEVSPSQVSPDFLSQVRDAARYGGTEFLDLIVQASEALTTRNEGNLPDPNRSGLDLKDLPMPYSTPVAYRVGSKLVIEVDLPGAGELSQRGRAENLVDPSVWHDYEDEQEFLGIKLTVCRPLSRRHWAYHTVNRTGLR